MIPGLRQREPARTAAQRKQPRSDSVAGCGFHRTAALDRSFLVPYGLNRVAQSLALMFRLLADAPLPANPLAV